MGKFKSGLESKRKLIKFIKNKLFVFTLLLFDFNDSNIRLANRSNKSN